jgi:hypothetical protein
MVFVALALLESADAGTRTAVTSDLLLLGDEASAYLGYAVAAGDVNDDGNADVIVASPGENTTGSNAGVLRVFYGPISNSPLAPTLSEAQVTISATAPEGGFGSAVAVADVIGDASPDLIVADPYHDGGGGNAGRVYIFEGPVSGTLDVASADVVITGDSSGDLLGWSLLVGDVDADFVDDLVLGGPGAAGDDGQVYVWSGGVTATDDEASDADYILSGGVANGEAGTSLALLGPLGDTNTYLAVGAPEDDGGIGVIYFIDETSVATGDIDVLSGHEITATAGTRVGEGLVSVRDGSGFGLLVANNDPDGGEVHYFEDPWEDVDVSAAVGQFATDESGGDTAVVSMANVGDVDGDLMDDVLFGDERAVRSSTGGAAYLFYNDELTNSGVNLSMSTEIFYSSNLAYFGTSVAGGDFNNDGKSDLLVGSKGSNNGAHTDGGTAHLFYGPFDRTEGAFDLADADTILYGDDAGDQSGYSVAGVGDVNCDGVPDLAVGAIVADDVSTATGALYVLFGPTPASSPLEWLNTAIDLGAADFIFYETSTGDLAGNTVVGVGDVDGDDCDDFLIAASGDDDAATNAGSVYLFYGDATLSGEYGPTDADAEFQGTNANDYFGTGVGAAGDLDGDGYGDLLIGQPYIDTSGTDNGRAVVYFGGEGANLLSGVIASNDADCKYRGEDAADRAGWKVRGDFDFNGDGDLDIAIGAPGNEDAGANAGAVYVVLGDGTRCSGTHSLATADVEIDGAAAEDQLGHALATLADLDGDGYDDIVAGAPYANSDGGYAYWIPGSTSTGVVTTPSGGTCFYSTYGAGGDGRMGWSVAGPDLDGDGNDDVFVGSPWVYDGTVSKAGAAYVFYADTADGWKADGLCHGPTDADVIVVGEASQDFAGWSVADAGDLNQDGEDDLLIGAYGNDDGGTTAGAAYVVLSSH